MGFRHSKLTLKTSTCIPVGNDIDVNLQIGEPVAGDESITKAVQVDFEGQKTKLDTLSNIHMSFDDKSKSKGVSEDLFFENMIREKEQNQVLSEDEIFRDKVKEDGCYLEMKLGIIIKKCFRQYVFAYPEMTGRSEKSLKLLDSNFMDFANAEELCLSTVKEKPVGNPKSLEMHEREDTVSKIKKSSESLRKKDVMAMSCDKSQPCEQDVVKKPSLSKIKVHSSVTGCQFGGFHSWYIAVAVCLHCCVLMVSSANCEVIPKTAKIGDLVRLSCQNFSRSMTVKFYNGGKQILVYSVGELERGYNLTYLNASECYLEFYGDQGNGGIYELEDINSKRMIKYNLTIEDEILPRKSQKNYMPESGYSIFIIVGCFLCNLLIPLTGFF